MASPLQATEGDCGWFYMSCISFEKNCEHCFKYINSNCSYGDPAIIHTLINKRFCTVQLFGGANMEFDSVVTKKHDCLKLERKVRKKSDKLARMYKKFQKLEDKYFQTYEHSQVKMKSTFSKYYHTLPSAMPYADSISKLIRYKRKNSVRHLPKIKITIKSKHANTFDEYFGYLKDVAKLMGGRAAEVGAHITKFDKWVESAYGTSSKKYSLEKGTEKYVKLMKKRQKLLDKSRLYINIFFCEQILPLEKKLYKHKHEDLEQSTCQPNEKSAIKGWASRNAQFGNQKQFKALEKYCAKIKK